METTAVEVAHLESVTKKASETEIAQLTELQLAMVGGGIGDVIVG